MPAQSYQTINPATGEALATYTYFTTEEINQRIHSAARAQQEWKRVPIGARCEALARLAEAMEARIAALSRLMTLEMGKPIRQSEEELKKCIRTMRYYAAHGAEMLADVSVSTDDDEALVSFQAIGVVLAIMPWNFPFWQVVRALSPVLIGGNGMVLKHASNVSGCALALEDLCKNASLPDGLFATLLVPGAATEAVMQHPEVAAVTFTGSTSVGKIVASTAAAEIKKQVLELGGSDAYVILEDADLDLAARVCAEARLTNTGQSCLAAKRFVVVDAVAEAFTEKFVERMKASRFGDPLDAANNLGPMARLDLRDDLHQQVEDSIAKGARLLCGGMIPEGRGAYYPPTVLADVKPGMPAYDEELFGPVAAVIVAKDEEDAIRIANDSQFGLGGAVFTQDLDHGMRIAREELACGNAFVNKQVHSDMRLPFGGVKESGYGRELGTWGLREFLNIKTVVR